MIPSRSSDKVHPGIALALLRSLRDQDTPEESLEDEAFADSLPRRLGLSDVVNVQMRRYADLGDRGQALALSEFLDLVRLISRRPDAQAIFRTAGKTLALERYADPGPVRRMFRRFYPESVRRRKLLRSMSDAARALSPGAQIKTQQHLPAIEIENCGLASAGIHGNACEILTAALGVCVAEIWNADLSIQHTECLGREGNCCSWSLVEARETAASARAG
ncbi:MAG: hypothetical protein E4H28_04950 [Gemmatimonadales bacterium]|nr:MAG: hypothetical protein E4H28_04950 [Gemmatimonadales bacterium]